MDLAFLGSAGVSALDQERIACGSIAHGNIVHRSILWKCVDCGNFAHGSVVLRRIADGSLQLPHSLGEL